LHVFGLDGYFRFRGDWLKNFNLGHDDDPSKGGAAFPRALACTPPRAAMGAAVEVPRGCRGTIKTANIRLRLEPTINIDERTAVHMQVDVLDNVVLGSTRVGDFSDLMDPRGAVIGPFSDGQAPTQAGRNSSADSIVVKRAWADIKTPLGRLKFGRMPTDWGLGILDNGGSFDPIHGTYDLDSDYGDTVDRLYFSALIPGTQFRGAIAVDWAASGPSSDQLSLFRAPAEPSDDRQGGQPFDLDDTDDLNQWLFVISRMDSPKNFKERVEKGELAINYGGRLQWRKQAFEQDPFALGDTPTSLSFRPRSANMYIPDVWARAAYGGLELELEGVAVLGEVSAQLALDAANDPSEVKLRQFGGVFRLGYTILDGDLRFGGEVGSASGDQFDNDPAGAIHISNRSFPGLATAGQTLKAFTFDPNYRVDMILFRELLGAVTNATYARPSIDYKISERFRLNGAAIISMANKQEATPGDSRYYGVEFDADLGYESESFAAGLAYGVFFPGAALNHGAGSVDQGGTTSVGEFEGNTGEASTAQTLQLRLMLKF